MRSFIIIVAMILLTSAARSEVIKLHIPIVEDSPQQHLYFHDLLKQALIDAGHTPVLVTPMLPQLRIKTYLNKGKLSIYWMIESAERDQTYIPIKQGLTNKLIGKRILFIKKGDQPRYDRVKTLDDFRRLNLVGAMGKKWFDVKVWKANNLNYLEHSGSWNTIFMMIPYGIKYDYFSRGLNEILEESKRYPDLDIEKNLVLIYDRDFRFYLSKEGEHAGSAYQEVIDGAMEKAHDSGLIARLVNQYWAEDFQTLNYDNRIKLYLETPK